MAWSEARASLAAPVFRAPPRLFIAVRGRPPPQPSPATREREQTARVIEISRSAGHSLSRVAGEGEGGGVSAFESAHAQTGISRAAANSRKVSRRLGAPSSLASSEARNTSASSRLTARIIAFTGPIDDGDMDSER